MPKKSAQIKGRDKVNLEIEERTGKKIGASAIIMVSLPLAFIDSVPALLISGHTLGISAMMGLLMLIGIVLTNAVVLVSMVEQQHKNGLSIQEFLVSSPLVEPGYQ